MQASPNAHGLLIGALLLAGCGMNGLEQEAVGAIAGGAGVAVQSVTLRDSEIRVTLDPDQSSIDDAIRACEWIRTNYVVESFDRVNREWSETPPDVFVASNDAFFPEGARSAGGEACEA